MEETKSIQELGLLSDELIVFGGVYSNRQALEAFRKITDQSGLPPSQIICTGDIVGYCADPQYCLDHIKDWGIPSIAGNVEIQLREDSELCGCNFEEGSRCDQFSQTWFPYAKIHTEPSVVPWLNQLPHFLRFTFAGKRFAVIHGSYFDTSEFIFRSSPWAQKAQNLEVLEADVILAGHAGLPFHEITGDKAWINAGVIGMPANDGDTKVWYLRLKADPQQDLGFSISHHSFAYDHQKAASLMRDKGLPSEYAHTLETGIWDNCEILPPQETAEQGKTLIFV